MERVKDLSKIKLRPGLVLMEAIDKTKNGVIIPDTLKNSRDMFNYAVIINKGNNVDDIDIGNIVLEISGGVDQFKIKEKTYLLVHKNFIDVVVSSDNFDETINVK